MTPLATREEPNLAIRFSPAGISVLTRDAAQVDPVNETKSCARGLTRHRSVQPSSNPLHRRRHFAERITRHTLHHSTGDDRLTETLRGG